MVKHIDISIVLSSSFSLKSFRRENLKFLRYVNTETGANKWQTSRREREREKQ